MYEYKCKILRIVDGDTVDVDIDLGFGVWLHRERVRIMGIDTPESRTRDKIEKQFGLASKQFLKDMLPIGSMQVLKTQIDKSGEDKKGKFGRILGKFRIYDVATDSWDFMGNVMIREGHAVAYHGQNKDDVQEQHLSNRQKLLESGFVSKEEYEAAVAKMAK